MLATQLEGSLPKLQRIKSGKIKVHQPVSRGWGEKNFKNHILLRFQAWL